MFLFTVALFEVGAAGGQSAKTFDQGFTFQAANGAMARIVRDSEAFGGVGDDDDVTFMETEDSEDAGTVKRNPRLVTRKVELKTT